MSLPKSRNGRGRENRVGNWLQAANLNVQCAFRWATQGTGRAFQGEVPSGPQAQPSVTPFHPCSTRSLTPQPPKRRDRKCGLGPRLAETARTEESTNLSRREVLLSFWVPCCQHFLHGAGWEKQLLGTDVAMGIDLAHKWTRSSPHPSPHAQHVSRVQSVGGTDRALSKITLVLSTPCGVGKREESSEAVKPGPSAVPLFSPKGGGQRLRAQRLPSIGPHKPSGRWLSVCTRDVFNDLNFIQCVRLLIPSQ